MLRVKWYQLATRRRAYVPVEEILEHPQWSDFVARAAGAPRYSSAADRELGEELARLQTERAGLRLEGSDTTELDRRIVGLKRQLRAKPDLTPGDWLADRFQLLEPLKSGGFARVWRALDTKDELPVAVKVLHPHLGDDRSRVERFFRGARQMARLRHPGIVRVVYDQGEEEDGYCFFAMDYVAGGDLCDAVRAGTVTRDRALEVIAAVGEALQHANDQKLVHRDVKPQNVLLDADGRPKLTDFDLVRAQDTTGGTRTGALGTVLYAAPETWERAADVDARADQYSLAMTLLYCLHGDELPRQVVGNPGAVVDRLVGDARLAAVIKRGLADEPERRYRSVAEFCEALQVSPMVDAGPPVRDSSDTPARRQARTDS